MILSVIIVSFNTQELLKDCLKSMGESIKNLHAAYKKATVEIYVVDNYSSDLTVEMVKKEFPQIKLIANSKNIGFARANNQALKKARGKYFLIINPDTILQKDTLLKMTSYMQENPEVTVATCRVELPNGKLDRDCRRHFPNPWRSFCHFAGLSKIFPKSKLFDQYYMNYLSDSSEHEIDSCSGAFMMIRQNIVKKVGLFDENFFFYGEDLDWCYRIKKAGFKIVYTPITKIIHYKGAASGIKSTSKHLTKATEESKRRAIKESTRAMELFYEKHYQDEYPFFINWFVLKTIKIVEFYRTFSL